MIKILTIEREYGSGAAEIARKLSDRLGWKLWDQFLTDEIARHMACDPENRKTRRTNRPSVLSSSQILPKRKL